MAAVRIGNIIWQRTSDSNAGVRWLINNLIKVALVGAKVILGFGLALVLVAVVGHLSLNFFAALSTLLAVVYLVSVMDVNNSRDAVSLVLPALSIIILVFLNTNFNLTIALTWVIHTFLSFFSGVSHRSGSLKILGLWPFLFGVSAALTLVLVDQFIIGVAL